jgi:uncharacterized protein
MRRFAYDRRKSHLNEQKHGVSYNEAESVFDDPCAILLFDAEHSVFEDRWVIIGLSKKSRILFVVHTTLEANWCRLISARRATAGEERDYAKNLEKLS